MSYQKNVNLQSIVNNLCNERFPHLKGLNILTMESDKEKKSSGMIVHADCRKVSEFWKAVCQYDFIITFYLGWQELSEKALNNLARHELMHCGWDGEKTSIVPHDVQDFRELIEQEGIDWVSE